jgi:hypothetical protein
MNNDVVCKEQTFAELPQLLNRNNSANSSGDSWKPIDLRIVLAEGYEQPRPTIGCVEGVDHGLFYSRRINMLFGDSGGGKTWLALFIVGELMRQGRDAIFIDYEDHPASQVSRLEQMGVPRDTILQHLIYFQPSERWNKTSEKNITEACAGRDVAIAILDSTGEALSVDGVQPNSDDEVAKWFRGCARFLANNLGAAVVLLDHVVKSKESSRNSDFAAGSHRKRAAVNGAAYFLEVISAPARDCDGSFRLNTKKCRFGWRKHGTVACEVSMKNGTNFSVNFTVSAPTGIQRTASGRPKFTWYMQQVSEFLESQNGPQSKSRIVAGVKRNERLIVTAIAALVEEGYARSVDGPRGAHLISIIKPYRQEEQPNIDNPLVDRFKSDPVV